MASSVKYLGKCLKNLITLAPDFRCFLFKEICSAAPAKQNKPIDSLPAGGTVFLHRSIRIAIGCKSTCEAGLQPVPVLQYGSDGLWIEKNKHLTAFFAQILLILEGKRHFKTQSSQKPETLSGIFPFNYLRHYHFRIRNSVLFFL